MFAALNSRKSFKGKKTKKKALLEAFLLRRDRVIDHKAPDVKK
jgi:hypothetical protein